MTEKRILTLIDPLHRVGLSVVGSFAVAASFTAAFALIIVDEGWDTPANAFYWASFAAAFVYFGAALWCYSARNLTRVWAVFSAAILICAVIVWALGGDANFGYGAALGRFVLLVLLCAALWFGFVSFALSQDKHWTNVMGERRCPPTTRLVLRWFGWGLMSLSVLFAIVRDGFSFGLLLWPLAALAVGLAVSFAIAYAPHVMSGFSRYVAKVTKVGTDEIADAA